MPKKPKSAEVQTATPVHEPNRNGNGATSDSPANNTSPKPGKRTSATGRSRKRKSGNAQISDDAIRTRAYFIAQERIRLGRPGDPHSDWIEARRQLLTELGPG